MADTYGRSRLAVLTASMLALSVAVAAQAPSDTPVLTNGAQKAGWWIRINPNNQASRVYWRFGTNVSTLSAPVSWVRGQSPDAVDVPMPQQTLDRMHVAALGMPPSAPVSFCLFFKDHGVALVDFTQERTFDVAQAQSAPQCTP